MNFLVAQLGARMHYAVPRIMYEADLLSMLHTDICAVKGWPSAIRHLVPSKFQPAGLKRLLGRIPGGIPAGKITAYTSFGWEYARRRIGARTSAESTDCYLWAGETFCRHIIKRGLGEATEIYTFNSAGLELQLEAKKRGLRIVMEQTIAPRSVECRILDPEYHRFSEFQALREPDWSWRRFAAREAEEWKSADIILCGSEFVVDGIREAGGPVEKTAVVPYGIDTSVFKSRESQKRKSKELHVLYAGEVGIRKGAHYLIEAARILESSHSPVVLRLIGRIALPDSLLASLPGNVHLVGPVPRKEILMHYEWADVFCLPSLCEGSATVTYEALAMGLPVITTLNSGSMVKDGVDGLIVPIRNADAIASAIEDYIANPEVLQAQRGAALESGARVDIEAYGKRLISAVSGS